MRFCRAMIQWKFSAPQGKVRISKLLDSLKLWLKRKKMHTKLFYYKNAWHFGTSIVKIHWNSESSICWFPCEGQLSYAGVHRDTHQKCVTTPQDANTHQGPFGSKYKSTKVLKEPRLNMGRSIISLSKIAHQMWHNHPFSQRNKTIERAVGWWLKVTEKEGVGGGLDKI